MLPYSSAVYVACGPFQFADTAIATLLGGLEQLGSRPQDLVAKIAGGASMFASYTDSSTGIGAQNIQGTKHLLARAGIPLVGWDVAGHHGRSVEFHLATGRVTVKALGLKDREF